MNTDNFLKNLYRDIYSLNSLYEIVRNIFTVIAIAIVLFIFSEIHPVTSEYLLLFLLALVGVIFYFCFPIVSKVLMPIDVIARFIPILQVKVKFKEEIAPKHDNKRKILNGVLDKLTEAQKIFEGTSKVCQGIGGGAETQLKVHALMCVFYKQYIPFKQSIPVDEFVDTSVVSGDTKFLKLKKRVPKKFKIDKFKELDKSIKIIQRISKKLLTIHKFKAAKKAKIVYYALSADKFSKQEKTEDAWRNVRAAEEILKNEFGKDVEPVLLNEKIDELTNSILYTDFPFSAPMCVAVDPEAYKNCIEFENETEVPNEVSRNKDVRFRFRLYYKPCTPFLESIIKLKLRLTHFGREDLRELNLAVAEAAIHEQFLVTAKNLREGENYIRADLFHIQKDCERKIATKEFVVQRM